MVFSPLAVITAVTWITPVWRDCKMAEWQNDEAFQRRYREIMLKKLDEWRDRESNRKLVD
jgi:hypothetical protein